MPKAKVNDIEIEYETFGDPNSKPLLLIAGLGSQLLAWPDYLYESLVKEGFFVIIFDNRDVGLSTKFDDAGIPDFMEIGAAHARGEKPKVPYTLEDMASDAIGVLDALNIEKAHVFGASMGGMIAQVIGYKYPSRILTLTIMMSTTGNPALPQGKPEVLGAFFAPIPTEREAYIEEMVKRDRVLPGKFPFDEQQSRDYRAKEYDRCFYLDGGTRQMAAMAVPGNTQPLIGSIKAPTLVIHGTEDPFYPVEVSEEIASSIPSAELMILDGLGHSFPKELMPKIIGAIAANSSKAGNLKAL